MDNPHENSLMDFRARSEALAEVARQYGVSMLVILSEDNPITGELGLTWFAKGNPMTTTGMVAHVWKQMILGGH